MASPAEIAERHSEMLTAFAELSFELAQNLQARALAAEDDDTAGQLARNFHQVGRALRQSLALHARLQREHAEIGERVEAKANQQREATLIRRKTQVGKAAERMVWDEYEAEEADFITMLLPDVVEEIAEDPDFLEAPIEDLVARIRRALDQEQLIGPEPDIESSA